MEGFYGACCSMLPRTGLMLHALTVSLLAGCVLVIFVASTGREPVSGLFFLPRAWTICCGAAWSPASHGCRIAHRHSMACIWMVAMSCPHLIISFGFVPKPEVGSLPRRHTSALSARWGWVVKSTSTDYGALHRRIEAIPSRLWAVFHQ